MPFALLPVLAAMRALYAQPRTPARFRAYLRLLHGDTHADLALPVQHFNPMAQEALVTRLHELHRLEAETLVAEALAPLNETAAAHPTEPLLQVALNLADDAHGGWTNRYATDYAVKFQLGATLKRGFCTPVVWASEAYSPGLIERRVQTQAWRSRYRLACPAPTTLAEHLTQEAYVARQLPAPPTLSRAALAQVQAAYEHLHAATDQPTLLNFLYGDEAARQLGYRPLGGLPPQAGFELARAWAAAL